MQKPFGMAVLVGIAGAVIGSLFGTPILYAGLAFTAVLAVSSQRRLNDLGREVADLRALSNSTPSPTPSPALPVTPRAITPLNSVEVEKPEVSLPEELAKETVGASQPENAARGAGTDAITSGINKLLGSALLWFTGGNIFMRVGIVLLFLGVGFLINYASGLGIITVEMRMIAIALAAIAGLVIGQRLLRRKRDYALMLQGAAIEVLYLDIFGSYSLYELIPSTFAFGLLFAVSALAAFLAVVQNAPALAYAGFAGGFVAPILASSGSGNYVGLFSYYVVLNLALLSIAWFKSWRSLNLLGFYFTFGVGALWGFDAYTPDKYASTQPFLIAFFLIFACIPVLYARRQPLELRGYVDGTLLFGSSVIAFGMQLALVAHFEFGAAWSAFAFGAFYIALASMLWRRGDAQERLLIEVFLALGVGFATLVIPFALGASDAAGAWALEGAGLLWIGMRQQRSLARAAGVLLQLAAGLFWVLHQSLADVSMFINSSYLAGVMLATAGFFSALLYRETPSKLEKPLALFFVGWFVLWWFGIGAREINQFVREDLGGLWLVSFAALSSVALTLLARHWRWEQMHAVAVATIGLFVLAVLYQVVEGDGPPHENWGWLVWSLAFAAYFWVLFKTELQADARLIASGHVAASLLLLALLHWELLWAIDNLLDLHWSWDYALVALLNISVLQIILRARFWPVGIWPRSYRAVVACVVGAGLAVMIVAGFQSTGAAPPLPWLPLLNPVDAVGFLAVFTLLALWLDLGKMLAVVDEPGNQRIALACLGITAFVWLNVTLFRALHHWFDLPYELAAMLQSSVAQTSMSILWVVLGMLVVVVASHKSLRNLWLIGGALLVVVVAKLFLVDLANTGSLARIVSFLGVGVILIVIGYFSPLPPKQKDSLTAADLEMPQ